VDLVLADTHLSRNADVHNGHAFLACWRALHPTPPFIFMDGWGNTPEQAPEPGRGGQVFTLAKPFSFTLLLGLIRAVLAR
jgi:hypothetical protein